MTLASTVFKKSAFQKFTNLNALGSKGSLTLAMGKCLWVSVKNKSLSIAPFFTVKLPDLSTI